MPGWSALPFSRWNELSAFLSREEWRHLHFSSRIKDALTRKTLLPVREHCLVCHDPEGSVTAACAVTPSGVLLPAFPEENGKAVLPEGLPPRLKNRDLFSIVGTAPRVDLLENLLGRPARAVNDYLMMTGPEPEAGIPAGKTDPQVTIRRALPEDLDRLVSLEIAYQKEEVLLSASEAEPFFIRQNLALQLREQAIFLLERDGEVIAKGGTNAIGTRYIQLGGVYTRPEFRGRGLAGLLVGVLIRWGLENNRSSALFVKTGNKAALRLYQKLGFDPRENFKILYYR